MTNVVGLCANETVRGFGCTADPYDNSAFTCEEILDTSNPTLFPTIVADEYTCTQCTRKGTDASASVNTVQNCTLTRRCNYDSVIVDDCVSTIDLSSFSCSTASVESDKTKYTKSNSTYIQCVGDVCETPKTVASPIVSECTKCYPSTLVGVNCAAETGQTNFICNQYFTFDTQQLVSSQAGTDYAFTSGVNDNTYICNVYMCIDTSGWIRFDLDTVADCYLEDPPIGYQR